MQPPADEDDFLSACTALHAAEAVADEARVQTILQTLPVDTAPDTWRVPFAANAFCKEQLLAATPAAFWRRLARRFPQLSGAIGAVSAALSDEDLLDQAEPETIAVALGPSLSLSLREGAYANGGIGRHVYAAATALGTLLTTHERVGDLKLPLLAGARVLELGCGLGLVGLAAKRLGAASVLLTDSVAASVDCAAANAMLNEMSEATGVCSRRLDWSEFATAEGAWAACEEAGLGVARDGGDVWWPDVILAADVCYSESMGLALIEALAHILAASPRTARAVIAIGWPNRGLARFERLCGARVTLAAHEQRALDAGEVPPPYRPFVDVDGSGDDPAAVVPRGLETLAL
eukprot:5387553-Prymnesium_polylepis.1